jgi:predicted site-specific integrase-resolvase
LITVPAALQLIGVSRSMLNRWIADNQVHVARDTGGQFRVCRRSLLERDA